MDSTGNLNANVIHQFNRNWRTRLVAQVLIHIIVNILFYCVIL